MKLRKSLSVLGLLAVLGSIAGSCGSTEHTIASVRDASTAAAATIGPAGGQLIGGDVELDVPAGAVSSPVEIRVSPSSETSPAGYSLLSGVFQFSPSGTVFASPVTVRFRTGGANPSGRVYWSRPDGASYDALPTVWDGATASASVTHFSSGFVGVSNEAPDAQGEAGPAVDELTSPVIVSGTISGGPLPADATQVVVDVQEFDVFCGLPNGGGCTPLIGGTPDFRTVAMAGLPPTLPETYSITVAPPFVGDAGAYVLERYFRIVLAYEAQGTLTVEPRSSSEPTCGPLIASSTAPPVCDGSFAPADSNDASSPLADADDGADANDGSDATDADLVTPSDAEASPPVDELTSPVTVTGTISGGPLPAGATQVFVDVQEFDDLCGLPNGGGCTLVVGSTPDFRTVAMVGLPPTLPETYSLTVAPPSVGDAGTYVLGRYFRIVFGYEANGTLTVAPGPSSEPACGPLTASSSAPPVCDGSF